MTRTPQTRRMVRVRIEGKVQGVGYRYWTERIAGELGLAGWVRNRRDGSVEALFTGPAEAVAEMLERCRDGPLGAPLRRGMVEVAVESWQEAGDPPGRFDVLPTP